MNNIRQVYLSLFNAIDYLYDKEPSDALGMWAGELNPFFWVCGGSADPAVYPEFYKALKGRFAGASVSSEDAKEFVREYIENHADIYETFHPDDSHVGKLFDRYISDMVWDEIWEKSGEESASLLNPTG